MVLTSKFLFRIPNSQTWYDSLDSIRCAPEQPVEVKEILGTFPKHWKHKQTLGKIPIGLARAKYT